MATDDRAPWEVIRAAADKLEKLAGKATPGPWKATARRSVFASGPVPLLDGANRFLMHADAEWISALSPAVAEPLVAWLRHESALIKMLEERVDLGGRNPFKNSRSAWALDFACRVLGIPPLPEGRLEL